MKTSRLQSLEVTVGGILGAQETAWVLTPSVPMCWVCLARPPLGEPPPGQDLLPVSSVATGLCVLQAEGDRAETPVLWWGRLVSPLPCRAGQPSLAGCLAGSPCHT